MCADDAAITTCLVSFREKELYRLFSRSMKIKVQLFLLLLGCIAVACRMDETLDVNQRKIYTEYELFYNKAEDRTYIRAQFRHKKSTGNVLRLTSPSSVRFDDFYLDYNSLIQSYEKVVEGYVEGGTFIWEDLDGKRYYNFIKHNPIEMMKLDELDTKSEQRICWAGEPLQYNENVMLFVIPEAHGAVRYLIEDVPGRDCVTMPVSVSSLFSGQTVRLALQRTFSAVPGQKTDAGGKISARYRNEDSVLLFK